MSIIFYESKQPLKLTEDKLFGLTIKKRALFEKNSEIQIKYSGIIRLIKFNVQQT